MQQPPSAKPPVPEEESDEPIIRGEARYAAKKKPVGVGEAAGLARMRELQQAEKQRQDIASGGEYVRRAVASGISEKQTADTRRAEQESVRERRLAERAEADARQATLHGTQKKTASGTTGNDREDVQERKELDALLAKFDHAKVELDKERHKEERVVNALRNEVKRLQSDILSSKAEAKRGSSSAKVGQKKTENLERELEKLEDRQQELKSKAGKLEPKEKSELSQLRTSISNLSFKLRSAVREAEAGERRENSGSSEVAQDQAGVKKKLAEIGEHESRLSMIEDLLRRQQTEKHKKGSSLDLAWRQFDNDLRKLGIHIYR